MTNPNQNPSKPKPGVVKRMEELARAKAERAALGDSTELTRSFDRIPTGEKPLDEKGYPRSAMRYFADEEVEKKKRALARLQSALKEQNQE